MAEVKLTVLGEDAGATKVVQNIEKANTAAAAIGLTWRQFTAERMSEYMKTEGGHAGAMKRMGAEWQQYKATGVAASQEVAAASETTAAKLEQHNQQTTASFLNTERAIGMVKAAAAALGITLGAAVLVNYAKDAVLMAARYETLGVAMTVVGNNAGYTSEQMRGFQTALQATGIAMIEARQNLTLMASAHIDLSKSAQLARIAQDAAVIGGINSSEAFSRMVYGIQSAQTEVLRTIGINVNFEGSYMKLAKQLGKTTDELTEMEKVQARTNVVLDKGKDIAGAYEAAMGTAGKQITSMKRYMDDLKVKVGEVFQDALTVAVGWATDGLKGLNKEAEDLAKKKQLDEWGRDALMVMAFVADGVQGIILLFTGATKTIIYSAQQIFGWASIARNALSGDFAAVGAWWDWMTQKTNEYNASMGKTFGNVTSFQDRAKGYLAEKDAATKNVDALKAQEEARIKAGAASRAEQDAKDKQARSEKDLINDLKNNITGIKDYASAMKDLGKERLALASDRYQEKLKQEVDRYKDGQLGIEGMIKPLKLYNTQVNAVYNERIANERDALDKLTGLYSRFSKEITLTANIKDVKQNGVEILKEVKGQAEQIIAVETDRYKTLISGEQAYASKVLELIQAKKNEIKELQNRFEDANKAFEEKKHTALGDFSGGYAYLDPNLDALASRQATIDKIRRDEIAYDQITDPARKSQKILTLMDAWGKLDQQIDLAGQTVITREQAIAEVELERSRLQEKMVGNAKSEQTALEDIYNKAIVAADRYKNKVVELDDLLRSLTRDVTINLQVNGMEQLNRIQGIVGSATASAFSGGMSSSDYYQQGDSFYWGDGTYGGPAYERGTERVRKTGLALVHEDEKITPASQNTGSGGITIQGGITISLPNVTDRNTADDLLRQLIPKLNDYQSRLRAA